MESFFHALLSALSLPQYGLSTVFVVAFVSATLLPMGSEPAVFGLIELNPALFWPTILVATVGNTLAGVATSRLTPICRTGAPSCPSPSRSTAPAAPRK